MPMYVFSEDDFCLPSLVHSSNKNASVIEEYHSRLFTAVCILTILYTVSSFFGLLVLFYFQINFSKLSRVGHCGFDGQDPFVMPRALGILS